MPFSFHFQVLSGNWLIGGEGVSLSCFSVGRKPKGSWHPFAHCAGERSWPIHYLATQGFIHTPSSPSSPRPNQDILRRGTKSDTSFEVLQGNSFHRSPWDSTLTAGAWGCHVSVWEMTLTAPPKKKAQGPPKGSWLYIKSQDWLRTKSHLTWLLLNSEHLGYEKIRWQQAILILELE